MFIQNLLGKLKDFLEHSESHEKHIIQKYINRYSNFSILVGMSFMVSTIVFCFGPLFLSINFPMEAWYPFPVENIYTKIILYIWEVYAILQTGFSITVDFMIAMLFWYPAARLEMLGQELQQITHENQMKKCIRKHQEIIRYVLFVCVLNVYLMCKVYNIIS